VADGRLAGYSFRYEGNITVRLGRMGLVELRDRYGNAGIGLTDSLAKTPGQAASAEVQRKNRNRLEETTATPPLLHPHHYADCCGS